MLLSLSQLRPGPHWGNRMLACGPAWSQGRQYPAITRLTGTDLMADAASRDRSWSGIALLVAGVVAVTVLYLPFVGMAWTAYGPGGWNLSATAWVLAPALAGFLVATMARRRRQTWPAVVGLALLTVGLTSFALLILGWAAILGW